VCPSETLGDIPLSVCTQGAGDEVGRTALLRDGTVQCDGWRS
jgi:hypothetical protein